LAALLFFKLLICWTVLVATFGVLDRFMLIVRALDGVACSDGFVIHFVDLAVHFPADRMMAVLVAFVPAMRRVDRIHGTDGPIPHLIGLLIDIACDLCDLDAGDRLDDGIGMDKWWHRSACWNCKSAKRNCQRRPEYNLSG
jgi:hypothetical protein